MTLGQFWSRNSKRMDDMEQKKNTETYLQTLVQGMRKSKDPSVARYRAFIFESAERSTLLVSKHIGFSCFCKPFQIR